MRFRRIALPLSFVSLTCLLGTVSAAPEFAAGRILVKPANGLSDEKLAEVLSRSNGRAVGKLKGLGIRVVEVPENAEAAVARALARNKHIAFAEPDYLLEPDAAVNDPNFGSQWHLPKIEAVPAWTFGNGSGVTVAILDTGVYAAHPDLSGNVLSGWNTVSNNTDTADIHNHGTWVAGVVAAKANNLIGGASVAPGAKILPIRITNASDGRAYISDMAEGVVWAADHGARVANISYAGAAGSSSVANAADYMRSKNGVVVVAAGNDNTNYGYTNYPSVFVAGATSKSDTKSSYSSFGAFVDISAPGDAIYTTSRSGGYSSVSGTSFASPNTAAVAAVVMSANPSLNPTDVTAVIANTAIDLGTSGWDSSFGYGRVNARAAAELAANASTSDTTPPTTSVTDPFASTTVSGVVDVVIEAADNFGVVKVELLIDGVVVGSEISGNNGRYLFAWDTTGANDGSHQLSARAYDAAGNVGKSASVTIKVANTNDTVAPKVTIVSPNGGVYNRRVSVTAFATDNVGVVRIDVFGDGKLLCSGTSSASCSWNLRKLADGAHSVTATAVDAAGNEASQTASFTKGSSSSTDTGATGGGRGKKK